ncbi:hypothetical protein SYNTR_1162 [Candidatus Syntrophocurvum alkaliphilum]|uniref:Serine aminopeptidase S33 domain-containing protein n=1 Tax=Candidatus Syntrophocurvum alkaliphilum TaxID=2293317 RepID=A0A6I6DAK6_9FIRM|nr:alpha/beta fold hydrolase [Candidatus Syntrophocurvum alkaliphilum]QGT99755.1 hypothetical protein SYNTR_1162 [Candidatus Syntrophocurvum alkaliphilum]
MIDYSPIDNSILLDYLFYPRKDYSVCPEDAFDNIIKVSEDASIHCRFYENDKKYPWVLYFHGNGEVVSDYDQIAILYNQIGLNIVVADYRGYGASTGNPSFSSKVEDAHTIYKKVKEILNEKEYDSVLWIMGRSLGSISALEIAYKYEEELRGMIIESGFHSISELIQHLGLPSSGINLNIIEENCRKMVNKIKLPSLIIHGEIDELVPLSQGQYLYDNLGSKEKKILVIPRANHNDILYVGLKEYFNAIKEFTNK